MCLNAYCQFEGKGKVEAVAISEELRKRLLKLHGEFITEEGLVNYEEMRKSEHFQDYRVSCLQLQVVDLTQLIGTPEALPFYLNIYNCLIIHSMVVCDLPSNMLSRLKFFSEVAYRFGHQWTLTANDIEHGILRANRSAPTSLFWSYHFKKGEPREQLALPQLDPRIHFALNCGAKSCPPIRVFSAKNIERGLQMAAEGFLRSTSEYSEKDHVLRVSKILYWYSGDFPKDVVSYVASFLPDDHPLNQTDLKNVKLQHLDYDWTVNATKS
jgi:hypothetical protein